MPDSSSSSKRNLPSYMSSKEPRSKKEDSQFSKLMDGVVFVLSGFVNPERSTLRSQALEMGAEYRGDWSEECTLLVCAFPNTPKFRQVEADCGTIVSKEWISECYNQKKLVDIDRFLMHAGKPWRKNSNQLESNQGQENALRAEPEKHAESEKRVTKKSPVKGGLTNTVKDHFSPSKIKEWAVDDLHNTISWLENQEEKPEASEVKAIAAEGIITCLQDAIESLKAGKDLQLVMEQWMFIPRVVKELTELMGGRGKKGSLSKEELSELASTCKKVYESEFDRLNSSPKKNKKQKTKCNEEANVEMQVSHDDAGFDSDQTIEMTEEEIDLACRQLNA